MKMKKYTAESMTEAMAKVQRDFGEDAMIVSSKAIYSKGFLGMFKKKNYEIVVGVEPLTMPPKKVETSFFTKEVTNVEMIEQNKMNTSMNQIQDEIASLKKLLKTQSSSAVSVQYPEVLKKVIDQMENQELDKELVTSISDELFDIYKNSREELSEAQMKRFAKMALRQALDGVEMKGISYEKKYINVLGPTGVGKTTTIAKMAARAVLEKRKKVGFITADTYRIGAIEQLKTYANLLQAPVEVIYSYDDYKLAKEKLSDCDFIFIDTAGRNYRESKYVDDVTKLIELNEDMENFLILSITAKQRDMEAIIEQFSAYPISKFIFTKLDETNTIGTIVNLMVKYNKGLAYYTNGQEVPEDIVEASLDKIIELVFQGE
ncbi:flagellar biosynthesis protein FlhF [Kurthia senegalensis]|uniref:flagellar biosynthesis protein FlhF n=1 Tax=Kurthia senegalensis TaxID=1033740 RepID=UPI00028999F2|nr:flagellar biosynthesis protein FlhF [Kurthia senegalensis]